MEKVSIIVPVHNAVEYLRECIESLVMQSYENTEIILVENSSDDGSGEICAEYAKEYKNIFVYEADCASPGAARNYGVEHSDGEYIMYVDSDDYLPDRSVVQGFVELFSEQEVSGSRADIAVGNYKRLWRGRLLDTVGHGAFSGEKRDSCAFRFAGFFSAGTLSYVWAKMYRRAFLEENGINFGDYRYAEDKMYNYMCYINGAGYIFEDSNVYIYRRNEKSVSNSYREDGYRDWMWIAQDLQTALTEKNKIHLYSDLIAYTIFFAAFFDAKMEYIYTDKSVRAVRKLLKIYASYDLSRECFKKMSSGSSVRSVPSFAYRFMIRVFAAAMRFHCFGILALGVKLLVDLKVDERLSDTGKRG